ncbi:MAG: OmpA family protein [Bacteroidota bacterium]
MVSRSQTKFLEVKQERDFYSSVYNNVDSLETAAEALKQDNDDMQSYLRQALQEVEKLTVANQSLNRNYQSLRTKYQEIAQTSNSVVSNSSLEKQNLEERLANKQKELDQKEAYLNQLQRDLVLQQQRLSSTPNNQPANPEVPTYNTNETYSRGNTTNPQLDNYIAVTNSQMQQLRQALVQTFANAPRNEVNIVQSNGKLVVSLAQPLIFETNSDQVSNRGRLTLAQLAAVLNNNREIELTVIGHTDSDGDQKYNWDRSVIRSSLVVKELVALNINPKRILAAGKGDNAPLVSERSNADKIANKRTEIILSPNYDAILNLIQK